VIPLVSTDLETEFRKCPPKRSGGTRDHPLEKEISLCFLAPAADTALSGRGVGTFEGGLGLTDSAAGSVDHQGDPLEQEFFIVFFFVLAPAAPFRSTKGEEGRGKISHLADSAAGSVDHQGDPLEQEFSLCFFFVFAPAALFRSTEGKEGRGKISHLADSAAKSMDRKGQGIMSRDH
jgi:hypothetical protein